MERINIRLLLRIKVARKRHYKLHSLMTFEGMYNIILKISLKEKMETVQEIYYL